jgi:TolC family type I secretion outer membrane protein
VKRALIAITLIGFGCTHGVIDPYAYAPKTSSSIYKQPLDITNVTVFSPETPLSLAEILDVALRNNPSTKLTWAKARAAAAQYGIAQAPYYPTLTGNYSYERSKTTYPPEFGTPRFTQYLSDWGPQLSLSYTILDFGQTRATTEAARQALFNADYLHNRQIQTILQQVTADYYNYLSQEELLKANEADLYTAQTTFNAVLDELNQGVKDRSDLLQAETQLLQTKIQLVNQKQTLINARATLLTDMGVNANQTINIAKLPAVPPIEEMLQTADQLLTVALQKRSDLIAAEANLKSQEAAVDAAWRQFWPTITYNLIAFHESSNPGGNLDVNYTSTIALNIPIFSGLSTLNSLKKARSKKEEAEATLRQTQLGVIQDVVTSHASVKTSFEALQFSDNLLKAAEEQYDVILARYKAGVTTILDLVSAQSTLANARSSQVSSTNQWLNSLINLSYAAGTLEPPKEQEVR